MTERAAFLLRLDPELLAALRKWADDDRRSLNGQIEVLLRRELRDSGRLSSAADAIERPPAPAPQSPLDARPKTPQDWKNW